MTHRLPDLHLLRAFGNESVFFEKLGGAGTLAARFATGLMEANRSLEHRRREEELEAAAARMNLAFRMLEDRALAPVREGARHTRMPMILMAVSPDRGRDGVGVGAPLQGAPRGLSGEEVPLGMDEGMVRMASAIGADLAAYALDKEAGVGQMLGNLTKKLKPATSGNLAGGFLAKNPVAGNPLAAPRGFLASAKSKLQGAFSGGQKKNSFSTPLPDAHNSFNTAAQASAASRKATVQQASAAGKVQPPSAPAPAALAPTPAAQPPSDGGGFDLQKAWDRTGLSNDRWKRKLPMLAAGALGSYALYAGAKKGFEILGREPAPAQYNAGGAIPAYGVNQYGVPDRSTPFM